MSTFKGSYRGIGQLLRADFIQAEMLRRAELVKAAAEAAAPDAPPYGVGYKQSFEVSSGVESGHTATHNRNRRAYGRVTNTSDHAVYVEFGNGTESGPKHRTLGKALDAAKL